MNDLGKLLMVAGGLLLVVGAVLVLLGRANFPLGRLPGDIVYRGKNTTVYFPLVTSLLLSVVLSIVVYFLGKWKK
jgi:H+/Cl- antiporter ClcA